jgi:hypothetical protein
MGRIIAYLGLALAIAGIALTVYYGSRSGTIPDRVVPPTAPSQSATPSPGIVAIGDDLTRLRYALPDTPATLATDGYRVLASTFGPHIYELNSSCRCSVGPLPVRAITRTIGPFRGFSIPNDVSVGHPLWVSAIDSAFRVDRGKELTRYKLRKAYIMGVKSHAGAVYVAYSNGIIEKRTSQDMRLTWTISTGLGLKNVIVDRRHLWVDGYAPRSGGREGPSHLLQLSLRNLRIVRDETLRLRYVTDMAISADAVWFSGEHRKRQVVERLDLDSGRHSLEPLPASFVYALSAYYSEVWALLSSGEAVRLDEITGRVSRTISTTVLGSEKVNPDLVVSADALWVSSPIGQFVMRLQL